jgi:Ca-activated chloride channel family protein
LIPIAILFSFEKKQSSCYFKNSSIQGFKESTSLLARLKPFLSVLRLLALSSLVVAMARPRTVDISNQNKRQRESISLWR